MGQYHKCITADPSVRSHVIQLIRKPSEKFNKSMKISNELVFKIIFTK